MKKLKPIFICGHRKSGTSMFLNLFDNHPELLVYPTDLNLLYAYFPHFILSTNSKNKLKARLEKILFRDFEQQFKVNENFENFISIRDFEMDFFNNLDDDKLKDMKYVITKLVLAYYNSIKQIKFNTTKFIIKETSIEIYANEIFEWFPDAKFLHLVREPKDNYAALKAGVEKYYSKLGENDLETLASSINRAKLGLEFGLINQKRYGKEKYKIVRFEDLVDKTQQTMESIVDFIDVSFDEKLLSPTKLGLPTRGNNFYGKELFNISNINIGKWKERISETEAKIIEYHFRELMHKYKYKTDFDYYECADSASEFYKWQNHRYFFSDRFQ